MLQGSILMKPVPEKTYRTFFRWGIVVKLVMSAGEILLGFAFALLSYETLKGIVLPLFGDEFSESPRDLIWAYVAQEFQKFQATPQSIWALIFISHGIVNLFLLIGLWRNKLWVYPVAAIVFAFFMVYQFYQLTFTPSLILWIVTIIDIAVIGLVIHEYRYRKSHARTAA
jgi:uncharacterized membrane protein